MDPREAVMRRSYKPAPMTPDCTVVGRICTQDTPQVASLAPGTYPWPRA